MKKMKIIAALCLMSISALAWGSDDHTRRFGIFVGANDGGRERITLRYAVSDARAVSRVFAELGGVRGADNVLLIEPDVRELGRIIDRAEAQIHSAKQTAKRTELVFYYSGHSDESGLLMGRERYSYQELRERINRIPSDMRIVILDSCASGAFTRAKGGVKAPPFLIDTAVSAEGHAFITSSAATEASQESDIIESSYFTHSLVAGLRGAADTVGDGLVTLNEAYRFAYTETLARTETTLHGAQHPSYDMQISGSGDVVLTDVKETSASLLIDAAVAGRLSIRDNSGYLIAEITKTPGRPIELGLESGLYRLILQQGDAFYRAECFLAQAAQTRLSMRDFTPIAASPSIPRGTDAVEQGVSSEEEVVPYEPMNLQLWPSSLNTPKATNNLLMGLVIAEGYNLNGLGFASIGLRNSGTVYGIEFAGLYTTVKKDVYGAQWSGLLNTAGQNLYGVQWAGLLNTVERQGYGAQWSGLLNTAGQDFYGVQWTGLLNTAGQDFYGAQWTGLLNIVGQDFYGVQFAGLVNTVGKNFYGVQVAGLVNTVGKNFYGVQVAGLVNAVGQGFQGIQFAGLVNTAGQGLRVAQFAGLVNTVGKDAYGIQVAGLANIAGNGMAGEQVAGLFNIADDGKYGDQWAGLFNIAGKDFHGMQVSLVNMNEDSDTANFSAQVGLVNISGNERSIPVGLVNVVKNGILNPAIYYDSFKMLNVSFRSGSRYFYSLFSVGATRLSFGAYSFGADDADDLLVTRAGIGFELPLKKFFLDLDFTSGNVFTLAAPHHQAFNLQGRLTLGFKLFKHLGAFAGVSYDYFYAESDESPVPTAAPIIPKSWGDERNIHTLGFFAGVQF